MIKLYKYLTNIKRTMYLPRLRNSLVNEFDIVSEDYEIQRVLRSGIVRDAVAASELMAEYNVTTADELYKVMPKYKPRANWRGRLNRYICLLEGAYMTDPHKRHKSEDDNEIL